MPDTAPLPVEQFQYFHPATGCARCPALARERHCVVWGRGPAQADFMFIGEAPGYNEDLKGLPFVGRAGNQLVRICELAGIDFSQVHIGNRIMCRPPGNRDPEPEEVDNCEPWLVEHVRMVNPKGIALFGRSALSWRFDKSLVRDTLGLMIREECDACGNLAAYHLNRLAKDGDWKDDATACLSGELTRTRVYAAIYHPAATLGGRNPEYLPHIVRELRRLMQEVQR